MTEPQQCTLSILHIYELMQCSLSLPNHLSYHTLTAIHAMENVDVRQIWQLGDKYQIDFTCIHNANGGNVATSIIDHFLCSSEIGNKILDAGVIHSPENRSDHSPVYCVFSALNIRMDTSSQSKIPSKPSWKSSTEEQKDQYKHQLDEKLDHIFIPSCVLLCKDVKCRSKEHCDSVDKLAIDVLETVQLTAEESLSCPGGSAGNRSAHKPVPGWNESVKPYRDTAYFWHQIWLSCGRPINNDVHRIMKRTKNIYHYQFRKNKKAEDIVKKNKLLDACLNGGGDVFKEIKSTRNTRQVVANAMDGVVEDIPEHFKTIYSGLYNSVDDAK